MLAGPVDALGLFSHPCPVGHIPTWCILEGNETLNLGWSRLGCGHLDLVFLSTCYHI